MKSARPIRRGHRQGGNAALEGSLVFMPFFALVFGIADFSMAMFIIGAFQDSARDAARMASTYNLTFQGTTYSSQTAAVKAVMYAGTFGFITSSNDTTNHYVQVNYYFPDNLSTPATCVSGCNHTWTDSKGQTTTINYENQPGDVVEVRVVGYPWNWMVPLNNFMPGKSITLGAEAVDVLQGLPPGTSTPPAP